MRKSLFEDSQSDVDLSERGLSQAEADSRRLRYGSNDILGSPQKHLGKIVRDSLRDPMLWFLVIVSLVYFSIGQSQEALVLLLAIAPIITMDLYLHRRTNNALRSLKGNIASCARVLRDDSIRELASEELVPGDLVVVRPGEFVPADGILLRGESIQIDESLLSGEAFPCNKIPVGSGTSRPSPYIAQAENCCYAGTRILRGEARIRVAQTGRKTLYGGIIALVKQEGRKQTPLQIAIYALVRGLMIVAVAICLGLIFIRIKQGFGWLDALLNGATLAVAALPEEFPVVYTFYLALGVYRMAKKQVLIREAAAVENIGRVTCICTDKTGTLTEGVLKLETVRSANGNIDETLALAAGTCAEDSQDPLDLAIREAAGEKVIAKLSPITLRFPFTEGRKKETVVIVRDKDVQVISKGAPETILEMGKNDEDTARTWTKEAAELAREGSKVIACASQTIARDQWLGQEPDGNFDFKGLLAFTDPPRSDVKEAVSWCHRHGIRILMITGDHPQTAEGVGRKIGLGQGEALRARNADELINQSPDLAESLRDVTIIARALPEQKLAFVRALQDRGEIVAVTGDGTNDVPALQAADIGIAMGERGTRTAREVASVVLFDDRFGRVVQAVAEGRQLFSNLRLSFQYLLIIHIPLVCTAILIPLAGYPLLYMPIHIAWLELIIHPTAMLAFQELAETKQRVDRSEKRGIFEVNDWIRILACGLSITIAIMLSYSLALNHDETAHRHARGMALMIFALIAAAVAAILSRLRTGKARFISFVTAATAVAFIQIPFFARIFQVSPLHGNDLAIAILALGLVAAIVWVLQFRTGKIRLSKSGTAYASVSFEGSNHPRR